MPGNKLVRIGIPASGSVCLVPVLLVTDSRTNLALTSFCRTWIRLNIKIEVWSESWLASIQYWSKTLEKCSIILLLSSSHWFGKLCHFKTTVILLHDSWYTWHVVWVTRSRVMTAWWKPRRHWHCCQIATYVSSRTHRKFLTDSASGKKFCWRRNSATWHCRQMKCSRN